MTAGLYRLWDNRPLGETATEARTVGIGDLQPVPRFPLASYVGAWRSLVARLLWEQEAPGSNPGAPTNS